jgi:hypothetical protein
MSAITRSINGKPYDEVLASHAGPCFVCQNPADAVWIGYQNVSVCRSCAVNTLPRLIADTVAAQHQAGADYRVFEETEREIVAAFWKGATASLAGKIRKAQLLLAARRRTTEELDAVPC